MAAPYAPQPLAPTEAEALETGVAYTFACRHLDPDGGNPVTGDLVLAKSGGGGSSSVGAASVVGDEVHFTVTISTAGSWTVQFRTNDGTANGPYSVARPFTVAAKPAAPGITDPTGGATITTAVYDVDLTHAGSPSAVQLQVLDPTSTTVLSDTASQPWATTVQVQFPGTANNTTGIKLRGRVQKDGIWSDWTTVTVDVDYPAVPTPTVTMTDITDAGAVVAATATVGNLTPGAGEDPVDTIELYRRVYGDTDEGTLLADLVPAAPTFDDWTVAHRRVYQWRAISRNDDGASAASAWVGDVLLTGDATDTSTLFTGDATDTDPLLAGGTA